MNSCIAARCPYKYEDENGDIRCSNQGEDCPCSVPVKKTVNKESDQND